MCRAGAIDCDDPVISLKVSSQMLTVNVKSRLTVNVKSMLTVNVNSQC